MAYFSRHLDTVGDGSGVTQAIGDYSGGGGTDFLIKAAPNEVLHIHRLLVYFEDTAIDADGYGATAAGAVSPGITIKLANDNGTMIDITDGDEITRSADWAHYCYDAQVLTWGAGNEFLAARWTFTKAGSTIDVRGDDVNRGAVNGEKFLLHLEDSFVHLVGQRFIVQGQSEIIS